MNGWQIAGLVVIGVYVVGALAMWAYTRNALFGAFWPLALIWMFFGNIG